MNKSGVNGTGWQKINNKVSVKVDAGEVVCISTTREDLDKATDEASQWAGHQLEVGEWRQPLHGNEWTATVFPPLDKK